ncbi:MAG: CBS domain-containing protein [Methanobacterium sp.]
MRSPFYTVKEDDTFEKAIHTLSQHQHHFKQLSVLDAQDKVTGIISRGDINNNLIKILNIKYYSRN